MSKWIVLVIALLAGSSWAAVRPEVVVGFYAYPPFSYMDGAGQARGILLEIAAEVLEREGYRVRYRELPAARLFKELESGEVQLWPGLLGRHELEPYVQESRYRLAETLLALFYNPNTPQPRLPESLSHNKVIVLRGYQYLKPASGWLQNAPMGMELVVSNNHSSAVAMLLRHRGEYMLNFLEPVNHARAVLGIGQLSLPFVPLAMADLGFVVSTRAPGAVQLLQALERQLARHPLASLREDAP